MTTHTIITNINIGEIIHETIQLEKRFNDCHWDQALFLVAMSKMFQGQFQKNKFVKFGGAKKQRKNKSKSKSSCKKTQRNKTKSKSKSKINTKTISRRKIVGGRLPSWAAFFCFIVVIMNLSNGIFGIQNKKDAEVLQRVKQTYSVIDLFDNNYGTCGTNTLLFLGNIGLKTHRDLVISRIRGQEMSYDMLSKYLNSNTKTIYQWESIKTPTVFMKTVEGNLRQTRLLSNQSQKQEQIKKTIESYMEIVKSRMMELKQSLYSGEYGIITALGYPSEDTTHAVSLWLTSENTLVLIDPQTYIEKKGVVLYTDNKDDSILGTTRQESLFDYFQKNLNLDSEYTSELLTEIHTEIVQSTLEKFQPDNPIVMEVIESIEKESSKNSIDEEHYDEL
jgi:hypothetical protein